MSYPYKAGYPSGAPHPSSVSGYQPSGSPAYTVQTGYHSAATTPAGYPTVPGYPAPAPAQGYPAPAPAQGYPAPAPAQGYPAPAPTQWYTPSAPAIPATPGYPPSAGHGHTAGAPAHVPAAYPPQPGYPAATAAAYPTAVPASTFAQPVHASPGTDFTSPPSYHDVITQGFPSPGQAPVNPATTALAPVPTEGVWRLLQHEAKIHLTSCASKRTLRIHADGHFDGLGGRGGFATFFVEHVPGQSFEVIRLRNFNNPQLYVNVIKGRLAAANGIDPTSLLRVVAHQGDTISLGSVITPGEHVGILPDGKPKAANATGSGQHGQFTVAPSVFGGQGKGIAVAAAKPVTAPASSQVWSYLYNGAKIFLTSNTSHQQLRILADGDVNGQGGVGQFAQFFVERLPDPPQDIIRLRSSCNPHFYINIIQGQLVASNGSTDTSLLRVHVHAKANIISLESVACPGQHVGILPNGKPKPAKGTSRGPHSQFTVKPVLDVTQTWNLLLHGSKIHLFSVSSHKSLRILANASINGLGGRGAFATFFVEVPQSQPYGPGVIRLRSANNARHYINIIQDQLVASNGATETSLLRAKPQDGGVVCLESVIAPGQHVGILANGQPKPASQTGMGANGQFVIESAA